VRIERRVRFGTNGQVAQDRYHRRIRQISRFPLLARIGIGLDPAAKSFLGSVAVDSGRLVVASCDDDVSSKLLQEPMPRDLDTKLVDVEIEHEIRCNELRWEALALGMREDEIRALLAIGVAVAERQIEALRADP
jgi:hypothetical protein